MKLPIYQVDAFTSQLFAGNPAAVCICDGPLDDAVMQSIAAENNLSETAFVTPREESFDLRWFTPAVEVDLCGHATLASAFVLMNCREWPDETVRFQTRKSGVLTVARRDGLLELDFPARPAFPSARPLSDLKTALGFEPQAVFDSAEDLLVVLESEEAVRRVKPDFKALEAIECRGIIVTAAGSEVDFVSRFFAPRVGIPEDPVTGSAHSVLIPYWSSVLGREALHARQVSTRGGELFCRSAGDRVKIAGNCVLFTEGVIHV